MDRVEEFVFEGLTNAFDTMEGNTEYRYGNLMSNDTFHHFLVANVDTDKPCNEVPMLLAHPLCNHRTGFKGKLILPLFTNGEQQVKLRRLVATIMADFSSVDYETRLQCVKTNKGDKYYGAPGLILNKDYRPIFVVTAKFSGKPLKVEQVVYHIDSSVMSNSEGLIEKTIYKKIIPMICAKAEIESHFIERSETCKPIVEISDCSHFIETPVAPRPSNASNDLLNDFIVNHIPDLCH
jgi:hypothetical protein